MEVTPQHELLHCAHCFYCFHCFKSGINANKYFFTLAKSLRLLQLIEHLWYHSCMHFERCVPVSPPATLMESSTTLTLSLMENGTLTISTSLGLSFLTEQTRDVLCPEPTLCACWSREEFSASAISQVGESCSNLMELMSGQLALIVGRFWCKADLIFVIYLHKCTFGLNVSQHEFSRHKLPSGKFLRV